MGLFKRLFCRHPNLEFVRNLYGDEIVDWGWKRSVWSCKRCDAAVGKDKLHAAPQPEVQATLKEIEREIEQTCMVPPLGWRCTRTAGHEGPCAAVPCPEDVDLVQRGMDRLREAQPTEARCGYCDGTGHVHDQTGEWRGVCICEAGQAIKSQPTEAEQKGGA